MVYDAETQDKNKATEINYLFLFSLRWKLDGGCTSVHQLK